MIQNDKDERENSGVYQLTDGKDFHIHNLIFQMMGKRLYLWLHQAQTWEIILMEIYTY